MLSIENKCPNCGATVLNGYTYCHACNTSFEQEKAQEVKLLNDIDITKWHLFIDKNSSRYVEIFSKNESNKIFFHMNWAAMFFNIYWLFYRKMYKYAVIFLIISTLFFIGLTTLVIANIKPALLEAQEIFEPYNQYLENPDGLRDAYANGLIDMKELLNVQSKYETEVYSVIGVAVFWLTIPSIILNVIFGCLADCIYRRYILRNIQIKPGGTSGRSLALGIILNGITNNFILEALLSKIVNSFLG